MSITSTLVRRAEIRFIEADESLRRFVGCFWVVTAEPDATLRIVPDASTSISIELSNNTSGGWFLRGPLVQAEEMRFPTPTTLIGVRLRPGVAFILSGIAAHALVGRRVSLSDIAAYRPLVSDERADRQPAEYVDRLQRFLIERLRDASVNPVVAKAMVEIERGDGCASVSDIAGRCEVSARHLNRLMREWVGYGPKRFGRIARFQATLEQIDESPTRPAAAIASEIGYFDQAHMTQDVARLGGATPGRLASKNVADFSKTRCDDLP
ncbi:MAG TPA: helix-turn-helix domain-containing protein [Vicinamibacterales bacterium]|jgi:AraC-like DNA-binding protein